MATARPATVVSNATNSDDDSVSFTAHDKAPGFSKPGIPDKGKAGRYVEA